MSDQIELDFTKGYNAGYLLAKFKPEITNLVIKILQVANDYNIGLVQGHREFQKEKVKSNPTVIKEQKNDIQKGIERNRQIGGISKNN